MLIRSNTYLLYYLNQHTTLVKIIGYLFKQTLARAQAKDILEEILSLGSSYNVRSSSIQYCSPHENM